MTHTISYENALDAVTNIPIHIASSVGINGTKRLLKVGQLFKVQVGKEVQFFRSLQEAVDKYNTSQETH